MGSQIVACLNASGPMEAAEIRRQFSGSHHLTLAAVLKLLCERTVIKQHPKTGKYQVA